MIALQVKKKRIVVTGTIENEADHQQLQAACDGFIEANRPHTLILELIDATAIPPMTIQYLIGLHRNNQLLELRIGDEQLYGRFLHQDPLDIFNAKRLKPKKS